MSGRQQQHLDVLGLKPGAALAEIRSAYKRLAIQWHPDKNKSDQATSKFQEISHAYTALTDPEYRSDSDKDAEFSYNPEGLDRFMNLFHAFFGSQGYPDFEFSEGPPIIDVWDDDDYGFEPAELFPLKLVESATNSLSIDWSEGLTGVPSRTIFQLDICSPKCSLPWSACYLGHGRQCTISGLLPGSEYQLRLGVACDCNRTIDISSETSCVTKGVEGNRRASSHPKITLITALPKLSDVRSYQWNFNRIAVYEKLVIDPDFEPPSSGRFDFGDDADSFEMDGASDNSDDLYNEYSMYSDGELADEVFGSDDDGDSGVFRQMNLNSEPAYVMSAFGPDICPPSNVPRANRLCRFFLQGACRYGNACRFSHDPFHQKAFDCDYNDNAEDGYTKIHPKKPAPPCRFFQAGNCRKDNCHFSHSVPANSSSNEMSTGTGASARSHNRRRGK